MRDNHKGRKSRRLSHSQNKVVNEEQKVVSSLLNANSVVGAGYFPFCNQEENRSLSQKEDTSRILTRRSKARASNQTSEKSSGKKQLSETGVGNQIRKRKAMEGRSLDMEDNNDPGTAMQSILRHLGSGFDVFAPQFGGGTSRILSLVAMMKSGEITDQMTGVSELCEYLSISTEESMITFPVDQVIPVLVELLDLSPEVMLLSTRAITQLMDIHPSSARQLSHCGGIETLCNKLVCIEYIDVAEQSIQALSKVAQGYPEMLLEKNTLIAILSYVDFFQLSIQRIAVATAAKICSAINKMKPCDETDFSCVDSVVPTLQQLMWSSDNKISLSACEALTSISMSCKTSRRSIESVIGLEFLQEVIQKMTQAKQITKPCIFYAMLKLLSETASLSQQVCIKLLELNAIDVISNILGSISSDVDGKNRSSLKPRNPDETCLLFVMIDNILPPVLPSDLKVFKSKKKQILDSLSHLEFQTHILSSPDNHQECVRQMLIGKTETSDVLSTSLLDPMLHMDFASLPHKNKVFFLSIVDKLLFFSSPGCLLKLISELPISPFLIRLLQSYDSLHVFCCLKFVASLLEKGLKFKKMLIRDGILHEIKKLADNSEVLGSDGLFEAYMWFTNRIQSCYLFDHEEMSEDDMEGLSTLRKLRRRFPNDDAMKDFLDLVLERLVSPYEVYSSEILEDLYSYLYQTEGKHEFTQTSYTSKEDNQLTKLYSEENPRSKEYIERFVDMIQEVLMNCERFPVYSVITGSVSGTQVRLFKSQRRRNMRDDPIDPFDRGLKALSTPLRIKLCCLRRDLLSNDTTILIEPLATISQVTAYLKPRIDKILEDLSETSKHDDMMITRSRAKLLEHRNGMGMKSATTPLEMSDGEILSRVQDCKQKGEGNTESGDSSSESILSQDNDDIRNDLASFHKSKGSACRGKNRHCDFSLSFSIEGVELKPSSTLLKVFLERKQSMESNSLDLKHIWTKSHQLDFDILFNMPDKPVGTCNVQSSSNEKEVSALPSDFDRPLEELLSKEDKQVRFALGILKALERILDPADLGESSLSFRALMDANTRGILVNKKLCSKLTKQLKDPLLVCSRALPEWCSILTYQARFLFSYDSRKMYFRYHAFGLGRTVVAILDDAQWHSNTSNREPVDSLPFAAPRISRQKVRISRNHILESARKVFERYTDADSRLEVEFYGEVGSGLGPTLEFYTLLSREFQRIEMKMWRCYNDSQSITSKDLGKGYGAMDPRSQGMSDSFIVSPLGLFPRPLQMDMEDEQSVRVASNFLLLGQVVAKAIQDCRLLDIQFSKSFFKLAVHGSLDHEDLKCIDPQLFKFLQEIKSSFPRSEGSKLIVSGAAIEDLCLYFVLPGDETFELCPGGCEMQVTSDNADKYVEYVFEAILYSGVKNQIEAFREGFNKIFPLHHLKIFYEDEMDLMICGDVNSDGWTFEILSSAIKCDHGYSSESEPVINLIQVLVELDSEDKRQFLKFVTGSPRLPAGGFLALNPRLTVVRKSPEASVDNKKDEELKNLSDRDLPSVMTCANYFKLPPYSSKEILKDRLLFAIKEGQGRFDLS